MGFNAEVNESVLIFKLKKLGFRKMGFSHTVRKWCSQPLNPSSLAPKPHSGGQKATHLLAYF